MAHLRSADFLDVEHYATITFKSNGVRVVGENSYRMYGDTGDARGLHGQDFDQPVVWITFDAEAVLDES